MRNTVYWIIWVDIIIDTLYYIPQLIKLIKTKKSEEIDVNGLLFWRITDILAIVCAILDSRYELIILSIITLSMNIAIRLLSIKCKRKEA